MSLVFLLSQYNVPELFKDLCPFTAVALVMSLFPLDQSLGLLFFLIVTGFWSQPQLLGIFM